VIFITSTSGCGNRLLIPGKEGDKEFKQPTGKTIVDWTVAGGGRGGRAPAEREGDDRMPVQPTYPGVYIEEVPSGVHTITGVATSITAFIGSAPRGPVNEATTINNFGDYERIFGGLSLNSPMSYAVRDFYLNGGSQAVIVRLANGGHASTITLPTGTPGDELILEAASVGKWGDALSAHVDHDAKDPNDSKLFNLTILEKNGATEKFLNVSVDAANARYLPRVLQHSSALVRVKKVGGQDQVSSIRPAKTFAIASPPTSPPKLIPNPVAADGTGNDGSALGPLQFTASREAKTGLYALENVDLFNLLCIPPYTGTGDVELNVLSEAEAYCRERRALLLVDPPSGWTTKATAKSEFLRDPAVVPVPSKNAALFFPRLRQANPLRDNQIEEFVPCGAVAGIFARTDATRGVWKAPAGQEATLLGVPQLSVALTDDENGELNPLGVNCLRSFPIIGRVVWGARTLEGADRLASEWKYIPVRRTALFIEESLYRGTQWVVFEPNDEPLWAQIRLNVGAFMHTLFRQGAFQGRTPREAYLVKCDKETTTQTDINLGIVNILVGFAPLKPAEFVIIKIQQLAGQIEV
jgi:phage tail sheath protein FI